MTDRPTPPGTTRGPSSDTDAGPRDASQDGAAPGMPDGMPAGASAAPSDATYGATPPRARRALTPEEVFREGKYPYEAKMKRRVYEARKAELQIELLKLQAWVRDTGQRIVTIFEGRDAAGKGGTIKRFMEHLNPRLARVVALEKPTEHERGQWYFQRYVKHLPTMGEIVLFDRSWYNRAGVERVMGFCNGQEYLEFLRQAPVFERMLVQSGIHLVKYYFSVTQDEQERRFLSRDNDPLKRWKLSPVDKLSRAKWQEYTQAKKAMFFHTDTADAPWTLIKSDDKKRARIHCMLHFLGHFEYPGKDREIVTKPDPLLVGSPSLVIDPSEIPGS